ncbi:hypothetical protein EHR03_12960 [Leptospira mayottensis]|uniref:Transcriptional regulator n=1 Tax=Leptospira mayottensis 200901116 TaxID=1192864 RepID=M6VMC3_9LEPT|nr:hypothetical protein [Leptospira mayottensis]AVH81603.1 hypothetical protein [Leptospira mayottensis 200901116]TGN00334.1 hypothetical protein EHR03_12960 [Leptospira mayottensis]
MSSNFQGRKWPKGVMSPEEIKTALSSLGQNLFDVKSGTGVSYSTVRDTISGRTGNLEVLKYLTKLGIKHGRTPSPSRKAG